MVGWPLRGQSEGNINASSWDSHRWSGVRNETPRLPTNPCTPILSQFFLWVKDCRTCHATSRGRKHGIDFSCVLWHPALQLEAQEFGGPFPFPQCRKGQEKRENPNDANSYIVGINIREGEKPLLLRVKSRRPFVMSHIACEKFCFLCRRSRFFA